MVFDKVHVVAGIRVHGAGHLTEVPVVVVNEMDCCRWTDVATLLNLQFTVAPVRRKNQERQNYKLNRHQQITSFKRYKRKFTRPQVHERP